MPNTSTTAFPTALDVPQGEPSAVDRSDAAMLAVQTKIGINGSIDSTSLSYKVAALESAQSAATRMRPVRKTANYTAATNDLVECDTSGGSFVVTLPLLSSVLPGDTVTVKLVVGSNPVTVDVTVDGAGTNPIDGALTDSISSLYESYNYVANSTLTAWMKT